MTNTLIGLGILLLLVVAVRVIEIFVSGKKSHSDYRRKDCIMSPAERECFKALIAEMGADYHFFAQVHLDSLVSPQDSHRQFQAFRHINQKSVDFVACNKDSLRPVFVIELDDKTHRKPKRIERDKEVERILHGAAIPLIRIENHGRFNLKELSAAVAQGLSNIATG